VGQKGKMKKQQEGKMKKVEAKIEKGKKELEVCEDKKCPFHGELSLRGRTFYGYVTKKLPTRIKIEFERTLYIKKFERYMKKKTKMHAKLPACMVDKIEVGDYVKIVECRPLSKILHFVVVEKIRGREETGK